MNIYVYPICDHGNICIEKVAALNERAAADKVYNRLFDRYEWLEGNDLKEIREELSEENIILGNLYDVEDF